MILNSRKMWNLIWEQVATLYLHYPQKQDFYVRNCILIVIIHDCICLNRQFSVLLQHNETQFQIEDFQLDRIHERSHMVFHKNMPKSFILWMFLQLYLKLPSLSLLWFLVNGPNHKHGNTIGRKMILTLLGSGHQICMKLTSAECTVENSWWWEA